MKLRWTTKMLEEKLASGTIQGWAEKASKPEEKKQSKFRNKRVEYDGIVFDSTKEKNRYIELRWLEGQGIIRHLQLQVPYELNEGGTHCLKYIADFVYIDATGAQVVEDAKGFRTKEYKKKKRLMLKVHGIKINET